MKKRNLLTAIFVGLAVGSAVLPSSLKAASPNAVGYYAAPDCDHSRNCPGGNTFCGYVNSTCTGTILKMAP